MFYLPETLSAWQTGDINIALKKEIANLDSELLPLQQGLRLSSYALSDKLSLTILSILEEDNNILVKAGLFYTGIIAGCNCADDPTPVEKYNEYCNALFRINKITAETTVELVD